MSNQKFYDTKNLIAGFVSVLFTFGSYAQPQNPPTIILVHGALLTSSSWAPVQSYLQNNNYNTITIDLPGRLNDGVQPNDATLMLAVEKVCKVVKLQSAPVVLVGHSQGGAIITQATNQCGSHIKGLVYVAAVMPLSGEKAFDLLSDQDNQNFETVAFIDADNGLAKINYHAPIKELFMDDATYEDAHHAIHNMVSEPLILADAPLNYDQTLFDKFPKFYIKTLKDRIISPETQDKYIDRQNITGIVALETGHSPFVSQPELLGQKLAAIDNLLKN